MRIAAPNPSQVTKAETRVYSGKGVAIERLQKAVAGTRPTLSLKGRRS